MHANVTCPACKHKFWLQEGEMGSQQNLAPVATQRSSPGKFPVAAGKPAAAAAGAGGFSPEPWSPERRRLERRLPERRLPERLNPATPRPCSRIRPLHQAHNCPRCKAVVEASSS